MADATLIFAGGKGGITDVDEDFRTLVAEPIKWLKYVVVVPTVFANCYSELDSADFRWLKGHQIFAVEHRRELVEKVPRLLKLTVVGQQRLDAKLFTTVCGYAGNINLCLTTIVTTHRLADDTLQKRHRAENQRKVFVGFLGEFVGEILTVVNKIVFLPLVANHIAGDGHFGKEKKVDTGGFGAAGGGEAGFVILCRIAGRDGQLGVTYFHVFRGLGRDVACGVLDSVTNSKKGMSESSAMPCFRC